MSLNQVTQDGFGLAGLIGLPELRSVGKPRRVVVG